MILHTHPAGQRVVFCAVLLPWDITKYLHLTSPSQKIVLFKSFLYEELSLKELLEVPNTEELMDLPFLLLKWTIDFYAE